jgi:hypothetical protein
MAEAIKDPGKIELPKGAHPVIDENGNFVGLEMGGVTIDGDDFNQATIDALTSSLTNPPDIDKVVENITPKKTN